MSYESSIAVVIYEALRLAIGPLLLWRIPSLPTAGPDEPDAVVDVAVVVPARNEERNLPGLLESLARQVPAPAEIIVVDDGSTDRTVDIATRAGVRVMQSGEFTPDWAGKPHACATGAAGTAASTIVFLDADVRLTDTNVIGRLAAAVAADEGGLITVQPRHHTERPYESLNAFFVLVSLMGTEAFTVVGRRVGAVGAFGPCLATSRAAYDGVGGHAHGEVRGSVIDDVALAARYRMDERRVVAFGGAQDVLYRMYPDGPSHLIEGWTKNIAAGARAARLGTLLLVVIWISGCIVASVRMVADPSVYAAAVYVAYAAVIAVLLRRVGRFPALTAALFPVSLTVFLLVFLRAAALRALGRRVSWKSRQVESRPT